MANYDALVATITSYVKDNANGEIGGNGLQQILTAMVTTVGTNSSLKGVITAATNLGSVPDGKQFWFAINTGTSSYNISGTGLAATAIAPGHVYIVHNIAASWAVVDLTSASPVGLSGVITSATNIGAVPSSKCFYIACNSAASSFTVTGGGSFSRSVAQNAIYVIHNLTGSWAAVNVAPGLAALISAASTDASTAASKADEAVANQITRSCVTLCLPSAGVDVITECVGTVKVDLVAALTPNAVKPDATNVVTDSAKVQIGTNLFSQMHSTSGDIQCSDGDQPYGGQPTCVVISGDAYSVTKLDGFWSTTVRLVLNVPHIVSISNGVISDLAANAVRVIVPAGLLSQYQSYYPTLAIEGMEKPLILYTTGAD